MRSGRVDRGVAIRRAGALQFFGWSWGASRPVRDVPKFTATYTLAIIAAVITFYTGLDPIKITVVSMIFAVMALPFTFLPMLLVANDQTYMGDHRERCVRKYCGRVLPGGIDDRRGRRTAVSRDHRRRRLVDVGRT